MPQAGHESSIDAHPERGGEEYEKDSYSHMHSHCGPVVCRMSCGYRDKHKGAIVAIGTCIRMCVVHI